MKAMSDLLFSLSSPPRPSLRKGRTAEKFSAPSHRKQLNNGPTAQVIGNIYYIGNESSSFTDPTPEAHPDQTPSTTPVPTLRDRWRPLGFKFPISRLCLGQSRSCEHQRRLDCVGLPGAKFMAMEPDVPRSENMMPGNKPSSDRSRASRGDA